MFKHQFLLGANNSLILFYWIRLNIGFICPFVFVAGKFHLQYLMDINLPRYHLNHLKLDTNERVNSNFHVDGRDEQTVTNESKKMANFYFGFVNMCYIQRI